MQTVKVDCGVCQSVACAAYTCPRCGVRYCRTACYQAHSTGCTEAFHRDHVLGLAKGTAQTTRSQQLTAAMLMRERDAHASDIDPLLPTKDELLDDDDDDDDDDERNEERFRAALQRVSAGDVTGGLALLSAAQRAEFDRALHDGSLAQLVKTWSPWWVEVRVPPSRTVADACVGALVVDLTAGDDSAAADADADESAVDAPPAVLPSLPESLPPLLALTKAIPSPLLINNLVDVLFAYVLTLRLYNGDTNAEPLLAAVYAVRLSSVLSEKALHETATLALDRCMERCRSPQYLQPLVLVMSAAADVCDVLRCRRFVAAALCDFARIVARAVGDEPKKAATDRDTQRLLRAAHSKLQFFQSWLAEPGIVEQLALLEASLRRAVEERVAAARDHRQQAETEMSDAQAILRVPATPTAPAAKTSAAAPKIEVMR
jgi:hypothetical protein